MGNCDKTSSDGVQGQYPAGGSTVADNDPIPEREGEYWGIKLVEVTRKVFVEVVNCHLKQSVELHDALHGFREGRGMGTATLEAKLEHQLDGISHKPLFQVFLNVHKAYGSLDRGRCLEIMRGYGLGLNLARLLTNYWERHMIVPKTA